jgi:hypothetical protein
MKKKTEKPVPFMVRLYKQDRAIIKKMKARSDIKESDAAMIRYALRFYANIQTL